LFVDPDKFTPADYNPVTFPEGFVPADYDATNDTTWPNPIETYDYSSRVEGDSSTYKDFRASDFHLYDFNWQDYNPASFPASFVGDAYNKDDPTTWPVDPMWISNEETFEVKDNSDS
jgi:hypothetical protein